jgi:hypothetical protein
MTPPARPSVATVALAAALALGPRPTAAQAIQSDFDRAFDFSRLRTYAYAQQARAANDPLVVNPLNDRRVVAAIDSQLGALGYTRDTTGAPDVLVAYHATTRNRVSVHDWGYGPGPWGSRRIDLDPYTEGTLVVDFVEAASRQLVWRGSASGSIEPKDADKKIRNAVRKLMERYGKDTKRES